MFTIQPYEVDEGRATAERLHQSYAVAVEVDGTHHTIAYGFQSHAAALDAIVLVLGNLFDAVR